MTTAMLSGPLLREALVAEHEDRMLFGGKGAQAALDGIASVASNRGCTAVVGASSSGERLVGALLLSLPGVFHVWSPGSAESVLVVEGVARADNAVRRTMDLVSRCGASAAFGVMISPAEIHATVNVSSIEIIGSY